MYNSSDANNLDQQIDQLMQCKPLKESDVKIMCEKVSIYHINHIGKRNISKRKQRSSCKSSSYRMWRYSWAIL